MTHEQFTTYCQFYLSLFDGDTETLNNYRSDLGALENTLQKALNDLQSQYINVSGARSRIADADMAEEYVELTKAQLKSATNMAAASMSKAEQFLASALLGTVDGEASAV